MNLDQTAFGLVATTLAKEFDSLYYVDTETDNFIEFFHSQMLDELNLPAQGEDFFLFLSEQAKRIVHPDDLENVLQLINKESLLKKLSENNSSLVVCRFILSGNITHICHFSVMCEDKRHILGCIKNIESEFIDREEQETLLKSAEALARLDEMTGVKNKNAFVEHSEIIDEMIVKGDSDYRFGVVVCDINNLKYINDTRGHSFGDEAIQRTCRMIRDVFRNSSVYRVGGDEFAVITMGDDYERRNSLFEELKKESDENRRFRTGPVIACGMAVFNPEVDKSFNEVYERADGLMYMDKDRLKSDTLSGNIKRPEGNEPVIPNERKRELDKMFGALYTVAGEGYVFLSDLKYSFSRWSLSLINDFGLESEYMYHVEKAWEKCIHPDDIDRYLEVVEAVLHGNSVLYSISYRARKTDGTYVILKPRGFVLNDSNGEPEYFGGIIIPQ